MDFKRRPTFNGVNLALTTETSGGSDLPSWHGQLYSNMAGCNPIEHLREWNVASIAAPTPTNIGTTVARCVRFRPPADILATRVHLYGIGATANLYKFAIYRDGDKARVWESGTVTSAVNTWLSLVTNFSLMADTNYWFCVTAAATGTVAGFRSPPAPLGTAFWGAPAAPIGNLSHPLSVFAQFAVTAGTFPTVMPALVAAAYAGGTTGSVPFALISA